MAAPTRAGFLLLLAMDATASSKQQHECPRPFAEVILTSLFAGLLRESEPHAATTTRARPLLRGGAIIDAGAREGSLSCYLARLAPERRIFAFEPSASFLPGLQALSATFANLAPRPVAIGSVSRVIELSEKQHRTVARQSMIPSEWLVEGGAKPTTSTSSGGVSAHTIRVERLDGLADFAPPTVLALAHFDVEGLELEVLKGAEAVIRRDLPVFTTECHVASNQSFTRALFAYVEALGYEQYVVDEVCGSRVDCRNLIHFPRKRAPDFAGSPTLDLAVATGALLHVESADALLRLVPTTSSRSAAATDDAEQRRARLGIEMTNYGELRRVWGSGGPQDPRTGVAHFLEQAPVVRIGGSGGGGGGGTSHRHGG